MSKRIEQVKADPHRAGGSASPMKRAPTRPGAAPDVPRTRTRASFVDDAVADGHEHGERARRAAPREESLIGTAASHTHATNTRAGEPCGEIAPSADTEGGVG